MSCRYERIISKSRENGKGAGMGFYEEGVIEKVYEKSGTIYFIDWTKDSTVPIMDRRMGQWAYGEKKTVFVSRDCSGDPDRKSYIWLV